ncbi:arsenic resistance N-acetyltransferase ArsN2 [Rhodohalobacter sp. 8-1]|uniref:arsenic resistance N-acetyltransferase ArsN2 n=1 Tax=Rhodohalobacter sp. 8-1 TaxID=3131972 RepID=UPI0030ECDEE4
MKQTTFTPEIDSLLTSCDLPVKDLTNNESVLFFTERSNDQLTGVVGIEKYSTIGLLRSLAVTPTHRGKGLGRKLVRHTEKMAAEMEIHSLWLLTDTAADFFETLEYETANRSIAPEAIWQSTQFRDLCPDSAVLMTKDILP